MVGGRVTLRAGGVTLRVGTFCRVAPPFRFGGSACAARANAKDATAIKAAMFNRTAVLLRNLSPQMLLMRRLPQHLPCGEVSAMSFRAPRATAETFMTVFVVSD
jgi:hypothetical protein